MNPDTKNWDGWLASDMTEPVAPAAFQELPHYSTRCEDGCPLVFAERIDLISDPNGSAGWMARNWVDFKEVRMFSLSPLLAAMRCYVACKTKQTHIELPKEIVLLDSDADVRIRRIVLERR